MERAEAASRLVIFTAAVAALFVFAGGCDSTAGFDGPDTTDVHEDPPVNFQPISVAHMQEVGRCSFNMTFPAHIQSQGVSVAEDGSFSVASKISCGSAGIHHFDADGRLLRTTPLLLPGRHVGARSGFYVTLQDDAGGWMVKKVDREGREQWSAAVPGLYEPSLRPRDKGLLILADTRLIHLGMNGEHRWTTEPLGQVVSAVGDISSAGQIWLAGPNDDELYNTTHFHLGKIGADGELLWRKEYEARYVVPASLVSLPDGSVLMLGQGYSSGQRLEAYILDPGGAVVWKRSSTEWDSTYAPWGSGTLQYAELGRDGRMHILMRYEGVPAARIASLTLDPATGKVTTHPLGLEVSWQSVVRQGSGGWIGLRGTGEASGMSGIFTGWTGFEVLVLK